MAWTCGKRTSCRGKWRPERAGSCCPWVTGWPATACIFRCRTRTSWPPGCGPWSTQWNWGLSPAQAQCPGGASAGGNLAVGAALYLKDAGRQLPAKLVLAYPFLHAELQASGNADAAGMAGLPRILRFTADDCRALVENYIGGPLLMASSYAMPGHADPAGLPPSAVLVSEYDDLRYSAELFIHGLRSAGIAVEARLEPGATHGYLNHSAGLGIVQRGLQFLADEVGSAKPFQ